MSNKGKVTLSIELYDSMLTELITLKRMVNEAFYIDNDYFSDRVVMRLRYAPLVELFQKVLDDSKYKDDYKLADNVGSYSETLYAVVVPIQADTENIENQA